ncbi:Rpn family recombination-promoting nuclease/putative transposase [Cyanobacterium stanieri LEGE 03274]|uniref:Rpn family recombination-promoting nuclease/putative transposase n=1 Tax=Cyanobacterium stanieri LEGE 03274 TaxID=1828756 RepID=A0ABR9V0L1_9CHRO|nr:Rpn family recombination-promoting nuclease/putative transposase [Cyanobacterium stanieri]MBE9221418.1 Rpn family recombination-promoting nuclease/putative transposase [Cyanobacterium stanieri LEGE 03274]
MTHVGTLYKFSNYSREELAKMFTLSDFKKTRFYQETYAEGKVEAKISTIPSLLKLGLTTEQIAQALELDIEIVKKVAVNEEN